VLIAGASTRSGSPNAGKVQSGGCEQLMIQTILLVIASVSTLWSLAVWLVGGFRIHVAGISIASTDPIRPLVLGAAAAIAYMATSRTDRISARMNLGRISGPVALLLALCPAVAGLARNSWTAAGSDSYAYVSQADLWLRGTQTVLVPIAGTVPWPDAVWTFTPHGYRPAASGLALVPVTSPGLSLLMAGAKGVAGHCAMFWVVPITGALLVWMTFLVGRRTSGETIGLAAAWLMATSPAFLAMLVSPMSDVPAAALWATAIYFSLAHSRRSSVAAGLAASAAIVIRANLAPLALVILAGVVLSGDRSATDWKARAAGFIAGLLPGCLGVAWLNHLLYGSPLTSGYGDLSFLFSVANVPVNLQRYGGWFVASQTPIALLGFATLFVQWPMLAAFASVVVALYLAYIPYDAWWYLRFLLPAWPAVCVGTAAFLFRPFRLVAILWPVRVALLCAIGVHGIYFASTHGAFPTGEGDHRYASVAKLVEQFTDSSSVILTGQNTGPTRYYSGRITLRFDLLDPAWLDRSVAWLSGQGRHPYFLLEEWEVPLFQQRFAAANKLGALSLTPVLAYQGPGVPGRVFLFDPAHPDGPTLHPLPPLSARPTCVEPAQPPMLNLQ
jgi:hypothetical protein